LRLKLLLLLLFFLLLLLSPIRMKLKSCKALDCVGSTFASIRLESGEKVITMARADKLKVLVECNKDVKVLSQKFNHLKLSFLCYVWQQQQQHDEERQASECKCKRH